MVRSQRDLERELQKLASFENPSVALEQYATPAHIVAEWVWSMALRAEIHNRVFLDAACGPGIIGLGLLLMGAREVYFLDKDQSALAICQRNYESLSQEYEVGRAVFIHNDITLFDQDVDCVVQNPPFGTKEKHVDKLFLETAFRVAPVVYSMHKWSTKQFVEAISKDFSFDITHVWRYKFPLKQTFTFHTKKSKDVDVGLWRMQKS